MSEAKNPIPTTKRGPTRTQIQTAPPRGVSPVSRQAAKEEAEAAALAEIDAELEARRARSAKLRKLRLAQQSK